MYADDLIIIAIGMVDLKLLLQLSINYFDSIDMPINVNKRNVHGPASDLIKRALLFLSM